MDIRAHVIALNETRARVWNEASKFLDDVQRAHPGEEMSVEEREQWARYNARLDEIDAEVRMFVDRERRESENAIARDAFERQVGAPAVERHEQSEADQLRAWARGAGSRELSIDITRAAREADLIRQGASGDELRTLLWDTGSVGSTVPTTLSRNLYQYLEASIAMFRLPTTKIVTASGENMDFPRVNAHAIATQVIAQGTAIGGTDPTFAKMTLGAFKYGQLVQLSSEVVQDSAIDIVSFVSSNVGRAVGRLIDADLVAGTGTGEPLGVTQAVIVGSNGTIATGGSLIDPTYEKLVDLVYSVNDEYRASGNAAFLMHDLTASVIRKLRDGNGGTLGAPLWEPSLTNGIQNGQPDRLLGFPVYTDPNVASLASNSRSIVFGDWSAYYVRQVGPFVFERSDDYAFNTDLVTFRGKWRADGDVIDLTALNLMKRSV